MTDQITLQSKALSTCIALVRLLASVNTTMALQIALPCESIPAYVTFEGLFASVHELMLFPGLPIYKVLSACVALVRLLPGMNQLMHSQM